MKPNKKLMARASHIDESINAVCQKYEAADAKFRERFAISDDSFDQLGPWSNEQYEYLEHTGQLLCEHSRTISKLSADKAALLLLAYHIARRGKPLHQITLERRLKKLPTDTAKFISEQMYDSQFDSPIASVSPFLHAALKKYGITYFDMNYLIPLMRNRERLAKKKCNTAYLDKKLSLFHKRLIQKYHDLANEHARRCSQRNNQKSF